MNAEPLPALEALELAGSTRELSLRRPALGSWAHWAFALDVVLLLAAAVMSQLGSTGAGIVDVPAAWLFVYAGLAVVFLHTRGMYAWHLRLSMLDSVRKVVAATALASMAVVSLRILLPGNVDDLAPQSIRLLAFSAVYVIAGRVALDWAHMRARRAREEARPTLVVGAGQIGALTARRLLDHPEFGLQPVGFVDKEPLDEANLPLPVLGASWDLERLIQQHGVEHVVVTFSTAPSEVLLREVERCEELGVSVSLVPRLFERVTENVTVDHIGGLPLLTAKRVDPQGWQFALKYLADRLVAGFILLLCLPVLAAAALAVRLSVGSPILFRQPRVGRDGREFQMLKLRTMNGTPDSGGEADADWADEQLGLLQGEPVVSEDRTTAVGRFLRALSIDELPQLLNVVRGDMSLVGPRPERTQYVRKFEQFVYRYGDRHRVKSGITGWAQVNGLRGKTSLSDRVEWDNFYIENWSLWLDVKILLMTVWAVRRYFVAADA